MNRTQLALVALVGCALAAPLARAQDAARVLVNEVREEPLTQTIPVLGRIVARETGVVSALVSGPVASVAVQVGDRVAAGDVLASLVDDRRQAELARRSAELRIQQARLATARARLGLAEQEAERFAKLRGSPAFPKAQYEDKRQEVIRYRSELGEVRASIGRAEADRSLARIDLDRTVVRAPYAGVVIERLVSPGTYVAVGAGMFRMINDGELEIEADVPSDRLGGLAPGTEVEIELQDRSVHTARVRAVVPDENPLTRTRQVRFIPSFRGADRSLAANQSVEVRLPVGQVRDVVSVHKDAVISRKGGWFVYVVRDGEAQIRPVTLGEAVGSRFEVVNGLEAGELAVVRGNERLRPGQKVSHQLGS